MENNFDNRDFEHFIKKNADQSRMFPSERVWKNINTSLHARRKWYGLGFSLLFISITAVTWVLLSSPDTKNQGSSAIAAIIPQKDKSTVQEVPVSTAISTNLNTKKIANETSVAKNSSRANNFQATDYIQPIAIQANNQTNGIAQSENQSFAIHTQSINNLISKPVEALQAAINNTTQTNNNIKAITETAKNTFAEKNNDIYPLSIESVINAYQKIRRPSKISWLVYITPVVSYRKLTENKAFLSYARSSTASFTNTFTGSINNAVTHKPNIGIQVGFNGGVSVSKRIKLTSGLQFNVNKYDIKAYSYHTEIATIALNNGYGSLSSVSAISNYRNYGGFKSNWLQNLTISASLPVGVEYRLTRSRSKYVGVGSSIQPTYLIADKSYLLSTDYQHYAEVPSLIRKWNVNSNFEIFAGNNTGKLKWRVGPQVHYQMLSSYKGKYPVQEHLFDFGIKAGILLNSK